MTIITSFGSIPKMATAWFSAATRERLSASTRAIPGAAGITSRPRRSITSRPTIASPIGSMARNRIAAGWAFSTMSRKDVLSFRNWEPTCLAGESNTVVPDPKDGNILYGGGERALRSDPKRAVPLGGELPPPDPADPNRKTWTLPQVFSQADEALYYSNQFVMRSRDRGKTWQKISPDLARVNPPVPANLDPVTAKDIDQPMTSRFGVVYTIGPSPLAGHNSLGRHRRRSDLCHARRRQKLE